MVVLSVLPGQNPPAPQMQMVDGAAATFGLAAQLEPGAAAGEAVVRVRAGVELSEMPIVMLSVGNESAIRDIATTFDPATGDWTGTVSGLPEQCAIVLDVDAVSVDAATATFVTKTTFTGAVHDEDSALVTADGRVEMDIPAGALVAPTAITIGGSIAPLPHDFAGRIVAGPVATMTNGAQLTAPATLRFVLPFESEAKMAEAIDPSVLIVLAFDETTGMWSELESEFHHGELAVEAEIAGFGSFALLERGVVNLQPAGGDQAAGNVPADEVGSVGDSMTDADIEATADCGTGTCGGGMAFASPLMLAGIGMRCRRRRHGAREATTKDE